MHNFSRLSISLIFAAALFACGGEDSTNQTCKSDHECVNDVCMCTTAGKSGTSCEEDSCESQCEVCASS